MESVNPLKMSCIVRGDTQVLLECRGSNQDIRIADEFSAAMKFSVDVGSPAYRTVSEGQNGALGPAQRPSGMFLGEEVSSLQGDFLDLVDVVLREAFVDLRRKLDQIVGWFRGEGLNLQQDLLPIGYVWGS